ncbi:glycosyltransferase family 39 protein [Mesonia ostreae]|uniref:Glycosyltransferase family 39 protein n=1 Tax=Mesonia ostreae TaxID=861110 RepID=A0ABU2KJ04_9FLAO|nr:glycosyltransferase family 39 protein [Mesonia ostreae]MDT0294659.1 glycosyltransferase family 39 protein [Mesonia ostreae]
MLKILKPFVLIVFSVIFFLMFTSTFHQIEEKLITLKILKFLLSIFLALGISFFLFKRKLINKNLIFLLLSGLLIALFVRLRLILTIEAPLKSDFVMMFNTANDWLSGNREAFHKSYYNFAVFNIPFTIYLAFFIKYLGGLLSIKVMNVLWSVGIVFFIYKITKKLFNPQAAIIALFVAALFPPFVVYTAILTNQTISIFFIMMGLYFLICKKQLIYCALFIGLGHIFRPIGTVFILAILAYFIIHFLNHRKIFTKNNIKVLLVSSLKIMIPFHLIMIVISGLFLFFNITKNTLYDNPAPSYKLLVGLNPERTGQWNKNDADLLKQNNFLDFERLAKQKITERTDKKLEVLNLFEEKFKLMWGKPDEVFFWANYNSSSKKAITNYFWLTILFFCFCFTISKKPFALGTNTLLIFIALLGFVTAYIFIEVQTRYRYEIYPLFVIFSGPGVVIIVNYIKNKLAFDNNQIN